MQITLEDIERHRPDVLLPPDPEFAEDYAEAVVAGREFAAESSVAIVGICRNAMPFLPQTLGLIEETGSMFRSWSAFFFENDSERTTPRIARRKCSHRGPMVGSGTPPSTSTTART